MRQVRLTVIGVFWTSCAWTQSESDAKKFMEMITAEALRNDVYVLAADSLEGRETGMPGQHKAAVYLAARYAAAGVSNVEGTTRQESYFLKVPMIAESMKDCRIELGARTFRFLKDFYRFPGSMPSEVLLDTIVFVGYGIDRPEFSDYKEVDVRGKAVMILMNEPELRRGGYWLTGKEGDKQEDWREKKKIAEQHGASAVLFVNSNYDAYLTRIRLFLEQKRIVLDRSSGLDEEGTAVIFLSPAVADGILKTAGFKSTSRLSKRIRKHKKPHSSIAVISNGRIVLEKQNETMQSENVAGFIEGSDPQLKHEVVVVSSHYDHIGIVNGEINNGADDDASGTACALAVAEAMQRAKDAGVGPKRSVLVLHFTGEEKGLLGSEWYTENPVFPLKSTVCNLNIDMVGRADEFHRDSEDYVYVIGSDFLSTRLKEVTERVRSEYSTLMYDYKYNTVSDPNRFYFRSDHYNFAKNGIPSIFYFSGVHEDYHRPGDDAEKLDYHKLEKVARLVFMSAYVAAGLDGGFPVDVGVKDNH